MTKSLLGLASALAILLCVSCTETPLSPTDTAGLPATETVFASPLSQGGAIARLLTARAATTVRVTLTAASPEGLRLGLGLGVPAAVRGGCHLTHAVTTTAGDTPQIVAAVEGGDYCVQVFDPGTVVEAATFSVLIEHP